MPFTTHIRLLLYSIFLLSWAISNGQHAITIDSTFTHKNIQEDLAYYRLTNAEMDLSPLDLDFSPLHRNFFLVQNTHFWFSFQLDNTTSMPKELRLILETYSFGQLTIYKKEHPQALKEIYQFTQKRDHHIEVPLRLEQGETTTYYLKVFFTKCVYLPAKLQSIDYYEATITKNLTYTSVFYGIMFMVTLLNLFFYRSTKEIIFLLYAFWVFSLALLIMELDGLFYELLGNTPFIKDLNLPFRIQTITALFLFVATAIDLKNYFPKLYRRTIVLILINAAFNALYIITQKLLWYNLGEFLNSTLFLIYLFISVRLWNKTIYARYIAIGFILLLMTTIPYVLYEEYGVRTTHTSLTHIKIGSFIEMVLFLMAISYRHKILIQERENIKKELDAQEVKSQNAAKDRFKKQFLALKDQYELTQREAQITALILKGKSNQDIAQELDIKLTTVKYHISNIFTKLDISKREQLHKLVLDFT